MPVPAAQGSGSRPWADAPCHWLNLEAVDDTEGAKQWTLIPHTTRNRAFSSWNCG
jgi:hypothetical protein